MLQQVSDIDLRLLQVFLTVVRCGGFAAAQPILNIGQPTISEHMNRLETRIGVRLCERGRGGFRLTEPGQQVHQAALRLFTSVEDFRHEISDVDKQLRGKLNIGIIDNTITNTASPLPLAIHRFNQRASQVQIQIEVKSPLEMGQSVLHGRLHAAIGPYPLHISGLDYSPLFEEKQYLYCSNSHPFSNLTSIDMDTIRSAQIVARSYLHAADLKVLGVNASAALIDNVEAQAMLILTGQYIGFLPSHYAEQWVLKNQLQTLLPNALHYSSSIELVVKSGGFRSSVLKAFLDELGR
jgi:DNA-binding transcriptional LysR family regulator|tara:strand:- start:19205 stop:20089 length:885 start_codon:yes stop_codon:yes gene_type:complete